MVPETWVCTKPRGKIILMYVLTIDVIGNEIGIFMRKRVSFYAILKMKVVSAGIRTIDP